MLVCKWRLHCYKGDTIKIWCGHKLCNIPFHPVRPEPTADQTTKSHGLIILSLLACNLSDAAANLNTLSHTSLLSALNSSLLTLYMHNRLATTASQRWMTATSQGRKSLPLTKQNVTIICNKSNKPQKQKLEGTVCNREDKKISLKRKK